MIEVAKTSFRVDEVETPDYTDVRGKECKFNPKAKKLHTALTLLLKGVPIKLDDGSIVALAWTEEGTLVPLYGKTEKDEGKRIRITDGTVELRPFPDWSIEKFFKFLMENISEDRHFLMCSSLVINSKEGGK